MMINNTKNQDQKHEFIDLIFNYKTFTIFCLIVFINILFLLKPQTQKIKKKNIFHQLKKSYELNHIKEYIQDLKNNKKNIKIYLNKGKEIYNISNQLLKLNHQKNIWKSINIDIDTCNGLIIQSNKNNQVNYKYFPLHLKNIEEQFKKYTNLFAGAIDPKIIKFINRLNNGTKLNIYRKINNNIYQIDSNNSIEYLKNNKKYILDYIDINHYLSQQKINKINNYCYKFDNCSLLELCDRNSYTYIIINHANQNLGFYHSLPNIINFNYLLNKIKTISKSANIQNQICYILNYIIMQKANKEPILSVKEHKITENWSAYSIHNLSFLIYNNKVFSLII